MMDATQRENYVQDAGRVRDLAAAIVSGELSPVALVERCLARIAAVDARIQAWRYVDGERALAVAREREAEVRAGHICGPLHGIPFGVKDVIDVAGLDTLCNSRSRQGSPPAQIDAEQVAAMKVAGAIVLGKVHTTEFAYFDPPPTRNPHNLGYTPGGSSAGSAAAVAAGEVPVALGTQTLGSANQPAAYCGIAAFKPSTRALSTFGMFALGASSDTIGFFGATAADAVYVFDAVQPAYLRTIQTRRMGADRIVFLEDDHLAAMEPGVMQVCTQIMGQLAAKGAKVEMRASPISFTRLEQLQQSVMRYEMGRTMRHLLDLSADRIGVKLRTAINDGLTIAETQYLNDRAEMDRLRTVFYAAVAEVDAFVWPAAPGPAPAGTAVTGDPRFIAPWTALGGPIINLPGGRAANGLPLGCILVGKPGGDADLSALVKRLLP